MGCVQWDGLRGDAGVTRCPCPPTPLHGLSSPALRCSGDEQTLRHCRRAQSSIRELWCCLRPAWPPREPTAAMARTVASCTPCPCGWDVSSVSMGWGVWGVQPHQVEPYERVVRRGLCSDRMGDPLLTVASPAPQTCRGSPLCPAEHPTMRISPAPGPPVWRPSSPPDTSPPTGDVAL